MRSLKRALSRKALPKHQQQEQQPSGRKKQRTSRTAAAVTAGQGAGQLGALPPHSPIGNKQRKTAPPPRTPTPRHSGSSTASNTSYSTTNEPVASPISTDTAACATGAGAGAGAGVGGATAVSTTSVSASQPSTAFQKHSLSKKVTTVPEASTADEDFQQQLELIVGPEVAANWSSSKWSQRNFVIAYLHENMATLASTCVVAKYSAEVRNDGLFGSFCSLTLSDTPSVTHAHTHSCYQDLYCTAMDIVYHALEDKVAPVYFRFAKPQIHLRMCFFARNSRTVLLTTSISNVVVVEPTDSTAPWSCLGSACQTTAKVWMQSR